MSGRVRGWCMLRNWRMAKSVTDGANGVGERSKKSAMIGMGICLAVHAGLG